MRINASRVADHAVSRLLQIPSRTCDFAVERGVRVPMRDGVDLLASHYVPDTSEPAGTLLVRCPYGRGFPFSTFFAAAYAARGYHVVLQSVRGTFGSGGEFTPMVHEIADGADTVAWLRTQPWFTGSFATLGLSYLGFTQWALLVDPPPELTAAVIAVGPHDFNASSWGTGSFTLTDFLGWSDMMSHQEDHHPLWTALRQARSGSVVNRAANRLPLGATGRTLLGGGAPWYESWLSHPDADDPFWESMQLGAALDRVEVPVLLFGGWQDLFLTQTLEQYHRLRSRGVTTALTVGAWTHTKVMSKGAAVVLRESLAWLDAHLGGHPVSPRSPVRVEITGSGWVDLEDWPPPMPEQMLYLQPAQGLSSSPANPTAPPSTFTYDPADPTPTIGGRLLSPAAGYRDDGALARRADVLAFTSAPLPADLYLAGSPRMELAHSCDNPHHDVFVRISEVDAKGTSRNVSDGYTRRTTDSGIVRSTDSGMVRSTDSGMVRSTDSGMVRSTDSGIVRLTLDAAAHRFRAGSRIRVLVAGGSLPRFARNLGTGEPVITGQSMKTATHVVANGAGGQSRLVLPAGPRPPSAD